MHAWEQIQIAIDYIEENISEEMKIENLAKLASLSQFYFQRLFSRLVKRPVNEYIKLRRLAKASEALLDKNKRILDIALDLGFSSHETLTRAFKDAFGMNHLKTIPHGNYQKVNISSVLLRQRILNILFWMRCTRPTSICLKHGFRITSLFPSLFRWSATQAIIRKQPAWRYG